MYGFPFSDSAIAGPIVLGWRAIVEAGSDLQTTTAIKSRSHALAQSQLDALVLAQLTDAVGMSIEEVGTAAALANNVEFDSHVWHLAVFMASMRLNAAMPSGATAGAVMTARLQVSANFPSETITGVSIRAAEEPDLAPLQASWAVNDVEQELKDLFKSLFDTYLRTDERYINALGTPHLGSYELLHNSLAADGLSIYQGGVSGTDSGLYLLRAWRAYNPKRGLHLLKTYLQLLWPNVWKCSQMWQDKAKDYPLGLVEKDGGNHFLTSRINVSLPSRVTNGSDLNAVQYGLRSTLPARFVLNFSINQEETVKSIYMGSTMWRGFVSGNFTGTVK